MTDNININELDSKSLSTRNEKNKDFTKRNFYDFRNIYKIEDFYCFSENNSYLNHHAYTSRSPNTTFNSNQILTSFKKNISTYLIVKKHYESNTNKYFNLVSKLKYYNEKRRRNSQSFNNILINDNVESMNEGHINDKNAQRNELQKQQMQMPLDIMKFNELKKINEKNLVEFEFIIEEEGNQKIIRKKLDLNQLESKFLKKHENFLNNPDHSKEFIIENLAQNFEQLLKKIKFTPFFIKMPNHLRPLMQSFNDFYLYDENFIAEEPKKEQTKMPEKEEIASQEKKDNIEKQIDEMLIDQILSDVNENQNTKMSILPTEDLKFSGEKEEEESEEFEEKEEKLNLDSHKILKKIQKYLKKPETSMKQIPPPPVIPRPSSIKKKKKENFEETKNANENSEEKKMETDKKMETGKNIEKQSEESKNEAMFDSENHLLKITHESHEKDLEEEKKMMIPESLVLRTSKMEIIDKLLLSKDIFNEDLSELRPKNFEYPEIPKDLKFNDESEKEIFHKIFFWLYEVELQVQNEKSEIEQYEKDYQMKFLDFLQNDPAPKTQNDESKTSFESEMEDEEGEEESGSEK